MFKYLIFISMLTISMKILAMESVTADDANKVSLPKDQDVILKFADGELTTTYNTICRKDGKDCFFTPYAMGLFQPKATVEDKYLGEVPVVFLPNVSLELFKPIFNALNLGVWRDKDRTDERIQAMANYLGYGDYWDKKPKVFPVSRYEIKGVAFDFVSVPGGTFKMGSPADEVGRDDDEVRRKVTVKPLQWLQTPVTQEQYKVVTGKEPSKFANCPKCPVEKVSYYDSVEFASLLKDQLKINIDLPFEEEWEWAARAETKTPYSFKGGEDKLGKYAWFKVNSNERTHPVAQKKPNGFRLYDMHGNVWEWTHSKWAPNDPNNNVRVIHGGSWNDSARKLRSAFRGHRAPGGPDSRVGFRVVVRTP